MTIVPAEQPLALIGAIYDAAIDPALWNVVLGDVARFVGGSSAVLFSKDAAARRVDVHTNRASIPITGSSMSTNTSSSIPPWRAIALPKSKRRLRSAI